jgi:hypothetical protein
MTTDQLSTESETPDRRSETDRRLSDRRVLRCVLRVGQRCPRSLMIDLDDHYSQTDMTVV